MNLGRALTLGVTDGAGGFEGVCVTNNRSLTINNNMIDLTKPDCVNPSDKLKYEADYGVQRVSFQLDGRFVNQAAQKRVLGNAFNQVTEAYQVTVPGLGTFTGDALVENATYSGEMEGELQASGTLAMSGNVTFVAEA